MLSSTVVLLLIDSLSVSTQHSYCIVSYSHVHTYIHMYEPLCNVINSLSSMPAALLPSVLGCDVSVFYAFLPKDPGGQHVGFLLNSLRVSVALTSDTTAKNLPKDDSRDHIVQFKGEEREGRRGRRGEGGEEREGRRWRGGKREALPISASVFVA